MVDFTLCDVPFNIFKKSNAGRKYFYILMYGSVKVLH